MFAVDVGRGQLHPSLAQDPRVVSLEGLDARALTPDVIPAAPELIVCDASFISLTKVAPAALDLAAPAADLVALVKPQFEVGPQNIGKGGAVRDPALIEQAVTGAVDWLAQRAWPVRETAPSPVRGGDGAVEHLVWARKAG